MTEHEAYIWIGIVGLMGATVISRTLLMLWPREFSLPFRLQRALRFAPMTAIAAIIVPSVLLEPGSSFIGLSHPKSIAVLASLIGWFLTRQMVVSMAGGVSFYLAAKFLI